MENTKEEASSKDRIRVDDSNGQRNIDAHHTGRGMVAASTETLL